MPAESIGPSPVQAILLVDRIRRRAGFRFEGSSLPAHLIHVMTSGSVRQEVNGRVYKLHAPCVVWYHEDERVSGQVSPDGPWVFFTVNFVAPELPPPPFERRVRPVTGDIVHRATDLLRIWRDGRAAPLSRELRANAAMLDLLAAVIGTDAKGHVRQSALGPSAPTRLWWELETAVRKDLSRTVSLSDLERMSGKARATIARSCHAAVAMPPLRRVKQVRLSLARGLVQRSPLAIKEIASRVGYERVHEFSRDYHRHFGRSPREDRRVGGTI